MAKNFQCSFRDKAPLIRPRGNSRPLFPDFNPNCGVQPREHNRVSYGSCCLNQPFDPKSSCSKSGFALTCELRMTNNRYFL